MAAPAMDAIDEPARSLPVRVTAAIRGSSTTRRDTSGTSSAATTSERNSPAGAPASANSSSIASAQPVTSGLCLSSAAFPAASAADAKRSTCQNGKFHGITANTTPMGSYDSHDRDAPDATSWSASQPGARSATTSQFHAHLSISPSDSASGLPTPRSSASRSSSGVAAHTVLAAYVAASAASTPASSWASYVASASPVAGFLVTTGIQASWRTRRRAGSTGATYSPGSATRLRMVPSRSMVISTTSPTCSGGGVRDPVRPHDSASEPVEQVPEASTSPAFTQEAREACETSCSNDQPMWPDLSAPIGSSLTLTVISRSRKPSASRQSSSSSAVTTHGPMVVAKSLPFDGPSFSDISLPWMSRADQSFMTQ